MSVVDQYQTGMPDLSQNTTEHFDNDVTQSKCCQHVYHIRRPSKTSIQELEYRSKEIYISMTELWSPETLAT